MAKVIFGMQRPDLDHVEPWRQSRPLADRPIRLGPGDDQFAGHGREADWIYGQNGDDFL